MRPLKAHRPLADKPLSRYRYANVAIGQPSQEIEMDLNMLASDFYVVKTSSRNGNSYDDFFSSSISKVPSSDRGHVLMTLIVANSPERPYPACTLPKDEFHLPTVNQSVFLSFAYCRPQKFTRKTLGASGSVLGLAASEHLAQTKWGSLIAQLVQNKVIERPIFSLMLINGHEGVLSIGGTGAPAVDLVVKQTKDELDRFGALERAEIPLTPIEDNTATVQQDKSLIKKGRATARAVQSREASWKEGWEWSTVQGAEGWWQTLMPGVWVDGSRVLQNQAVVLDVRPRNWSLFRRGSGTNKLTGQLSFDPCASDGCQSVLRLHLGLLPAACTAFELLRFPMHKSADTSFRIRDDQVSGDARWPRCRLVEHTRRTVQSG